MQIDERGHHAQFDGFLHLISHWLDYFQIDEVEIDGISRIVADGLVALPDKVN